MTSLLISGYGSSSSSTLKYFTYPNEEPHQMCSLKLLNPSFACTYNNLLFTLCEVDSESKIQLFQFTASGLTYLDEITLEGAGLCHISYSPKHSCLFGACYETGHIFSIGVSNFRFTAIHSFIRLEPNLSDQISRAHCIQMDPSEHFLYAVNIHTDQIYCYTVQDGTLIPNAAFPLLQLPDGIGPRHIIFHPSSHNAYIITEYSNEILVFEQNPLTGALKDIQTLSTLPLGYTEKSYCSTCVITPNREYLLAANRGHNSITRFKILGDGTLKLLDFASCYGKWPRHIACTPDGKSLMICNQHSHAISLVSLNQTTSKIGSVFTQIPFNEPSYVTSF